MNQLKTILIAALIAVPSTAFAEETAKEKAAEKAQRAEQKAAIDVAVGKISTEQYDKIREKAEKASIAAEKERQERIGANKGSR